MSCNTASYFLVPPVQLVQNGSSEIYEVGLNCKLSLPWRVETFVWTQV